MPQLRRSAERRRRVLYQSHVSPLTPSTPATRRAAEELRAARQPAKAFGSRVHQHLRGRWFSLVPVSRFSMSVLALAVICGSAVLTVLHYLAISWPALAYREGLVRPLMINRPDSFAAWWITMLLLLAAGATRLIYVLRRHRRDDYRGHYQLWQLTLIVLLLASVHSSVDLVSWLGAWLDLVVGDRAVLSGANWFRIVLDVSGIILAMRLIAEVYRCRPALIAMLASGFFFAFGEAALWRVITVDGVAKATLIIATPMLGWSCFLVAATFYLRSMYRQIRNIPDAPSVRVKFAQWLENRRLREEDDPDTEFFETSPPPRPAVTSVEFDRPDVTPASDRRSSVVASKRSDQHDGDDDDEDDSEAHTQTEKKPGLFSRFRRRPRNEASQEDPAPASQSSSDNTVHETKASGDESVGPDRPKRRWFGLRAAKSKGSGQASDDGGDSLAEQQAEQQAEPAAPRRRRFSLRLKPQRIDADAGGNDAADNQAAARRSTADEVDGNDADSGRKPGWFAGLWRRKQRDAAEENSDDESAISQPSVESGRRSGPLASRAKGLLSGGARSVNAPRADASGQAGTPAIDLDDDDLDPDSIDWESLSKADRRRLRKKLKRSGRAA